MCAAHPLSVKKHEASRRRGQTGKTDDGSVSLEPGCLCWDLTEGSYAAHLKLMNLSFLICKVGITRQLVIPHLTALHRYYVCLQRQIED